MDVYEQLLDLGRQLYRGDEAAAQRFARGRATSEAAAREQLGPAPDRAARPRSRAELENQLYTQLRAVGVGEVEASRRAHAATSGVTVAESVATLERPQAGTLVREQSGAARGTGPGKMLVRLISAGWSDNGRHYGAAVLKRDGAEAFPAGTQMHIDHATDSEDAERPVGSLRTLAGVLESAARYDDGHGGLVADVRLFRSWAATLADMAEHIGVSIRAFVDGEPGRVGGRDGFVVDRLIEGRSVDFVTRAAAGGRILAAVEGRCR